MLKTITRFSFSMVLALGLILGTAEARDRFAPEVVDVEATSTYIPMGFDDNDNAQIVIEGFYPNTCYRRGPIEISIDDAEVSEGKRGQIVIQPTAYRYHGPCLQMFVRYERTIDLGILTEGKYDVLVGKIHEEETLTIAHSETPRADDYLYAPVKNARVISREDKELEITFEFPSSCMTLDRFIEHDVHGNVVALLPVATVSEDLDICDAKIVEETVEYRLKANISGRYMIHIRSLDGESFNLIEDF